MRQYVGVAALGAALLTATPALACSHVGYSAKWTLGAEDLSVHLVRSAAIVELVVAESARVLGGEYPELLDQAMMSIEVVEGRSDPAEISYRVLERLKGAGLESFRLKGAVLTLPSGTATAPKFHSGDYSDPRAVYEAESLRTLDEPNDCRMVLPAVVGGRYLIFRDADGRLLGETVPFHSRGGHSTVTVVASGPVYEAVPSDDDPWLARVRKAAAAQGGR